MINNDKGRDDIVELRRQAEIIAQRKKIQSSKDLETFSSEEIRQIFHELQVHQIELEMQNEELRRTQDELSIVKERFFDLYDLAPVGYVTVSENGLILEANLTAATLLGVARGALIKNPISLFILKEDQDIFYLHKTKLIQTGNAQSYQLRMMKKDGTIFWANLESTVELDEGERTPVCRIVLSDISERKFREDMVELTTELIAQFSTPDDLHQRMSSLTVTLQVWSGCEAVGIRLKAGDDFPYYETRGFPAAFVQAESHLCARESSGEIMHSSTGNPVLECMCGNILCGRFDPAKPFFTANGSFWSNNTTALLASTTETDRQARTRNRCNGEGYESVALIPLRIDHQILGLLQFNDHHPNRFTPVLIAHLEKIADVLSIALLRHQTKERLRESELFFKESQRAAQIGSYKADFVEGFWKSSEVLDQIFGIDNSYVRSIEGWLDIIHPDDREMMEKYLGEEVIAKHRSFSKDYRIVRKSNNEVRWVNGLGTLSYDAGGNTVSMVGTIQDITDRKHAEQALREQQWRMESIIEGTHAGTWEWNIQTGETNFNERWAEIVGFTLDELAPISIKTWDKLCHPDDLKQSTELLQQHFAGELAYYSCECRMKHKDGSWIWVLDRGRVISRTEEGKPMMMYGTHADITERKQIEEAVRESEERLSSAAKAANFGVYSYDFESGQAYYSLEFLSFYGLPPGSSLELDDDLTPKSLHPDDKPGFLTKMNAANDPCGSGILEHVYRVIRPDGQVCWLRVNGQTFFSGRQPNDRPLHATGVVQDITEGKRLGEEQKQWEQKRQQLQRAESMKTMAGAIAHHFNNQLAAVMGNLEIAIDDMPRDAKYAHLLNDALQGARNAVEVSRLMLTYLGQTTGKHAPLDLSETCRQSLPLLLAAIPKHVLFATNLPTPGPIINANATQIQQALTNLVTNAWEAAEKKPATIDLTVKVVSPADIPESHCFPIDWKPQDLDYACMEIKDTSGGIAEGDIEKLFDPFFSSKFSGRGLGLPVALGIMSAHNGAITVESEVGRGSTFRVYIPVSAKTAMPQPDKAAPHPAIERIGTVLLVEDEEIVRNMSQTMLARLGFKVVTARDGVEAVEIFQQHLDEIDIVLTDLSMPRMDGWETLSALRRIRPDIPVILASGHDDSLVNAGDHSELPQVFLHKPFQKAELKDSLMRAMGGLPMNHDPEGNTPPSTGDSH